VDNVGVPIVISCLVNIYCILVGDRQRSLSLNGATMNNYLISYIL
jgi:hypothetical protein